MAKSRKVKAPVPLVCYLLELGVPEQEALARIMEALNQRKPEGCKPTTKAEAIRRSMHHFARYLEGDEL